jgi:quercetin dioxygenase-like cupin family protein
MEAMKNSNIVMPKVKLNQLVNYVEKSWGHEEWIVNNSKYCGKKLVVRKGFRCSMHQHKVKDETFYVLSGEILLETEYKEYKENRIMTPGDVAHIKIGMWHRFTSLQDISEIIEFSTFHMDSDSYRREIGGKVNLSELQLY